MNKPGQNPLIQGIKVSYQRQGGNDNLRQSNPIQGESATLKSSRARKPLKIHKKTVQKTDLFPKVSGKVVNRMKR